MGKMSTMRQCECGAYRLAKKVKGEWVWAAGCRACDKIARLYVLLDGGVKVICKESPSRIREKLVRAEEEVDRLKRDIAVTEERHRDELRVARNVCPVSGAWVHQCDDDEDDDEAQTNPGREWN